MGGWRKLGPEDYADSEWEHEMKMNNIPTSILPKSSGKLSKGGFRGGTLVICPVIALSQWKTEIEKFTEDL